MKQSIINLSNSEKLFLKSLTNGAKTDAQIAREAGISKATANRVRRGLEKKKIIETYMPIFNLDKLGVKIFMTILFQWKGFKSEKLTKLLMKDLEEDKNVAFFASGEGSGFTNIAFLGFLDLSQAHTYLTRFRTKYGSDIENLITFFVPSNEIKKQDYTDLVKMVL